MFRFSRARLFANCEERILVFTADDHDLTGVNAALDDSIVVRKGTVSPELTHGAETIFNNEQCSVDGKFRRIIKRVYRLASIVCAEAVSIQSVLLHRIKRDGPAAEVGIKMLQKNRLPAF